MMTKNQLNLLKKAFEEAAETELAEYGTMPETEAAPRDGLRPISARKYKKYIGRTKKRLVAALAAIMALFAFSMSVAAIREPVVAFTIEVYDRFTELFIDDTTVTAPRTIEKEYTVTNLPEGYLLSSQLTDDSASLQVWENGTRFIIFRQTVINGSAFQINTEENGYEEISVNSQTVYYLHASGKRLFLWTTQEYVFSLSCSDSVSFEDAVSMIDSIQ